MKLITKKQIESLHEIHEPYCISIFIPTHRAGNEVLKKQDSLSLKNQLKEVTKKLEGHGLTRLEIENRLNPLKKMLDDGEFWRHQSDGLALFLTKDVFEKFSLPIFFEPFNYVGNELYLKPLIPMFTGDGTYFVLALELENIHFYECSRYTISKIEIKDIVPSRMEEVVGFEFEQKNLQFRNEQKGQALFHGQGAGEDDKKNEIKCYFRAIDKGLMKILNEENKPLLVATQENFFSIYKEVNTYNRLINVPIAYNPSSLNTVALQELSWEAIKPVFDQDRKDKITTFKEFQDSEKASSFTNDILAAALEGKIDTLFCENNVEINGIYNPVRNEVKLYDEKRIPNSSLINLAVLQTFLKGGKVYLLEHEEMPNPYAKMNAIFRY